MEVKKDNLLARGSCSFCHGAPLYRKVYEVLGAGGTVVRLCKACVVELNKQIGNIEKR